MDGVQKLTQKDNETWEIGFSRGLPFADLTTPTGEFSMRNGIFYFILNLFYFIFIFIYFKI